MGSKSYSKVLEGAGGPSLTTQSQSSERVCSGTLSAGAFCDHKKKNIPLGDARRAGEVAQVAREVVRVAREVVRGRGIKGRVSVRRGRGGRGQARILLVPLGNFRRALVRPTPVLIHARARRTIARRRRRHIALWGRRIGHGPPLHYLCVGVRGGISGL